MELSAVSNVKQQNFKGNTKSVSSQEKTPQEIKNGKKKLALAAAGAATFAIAAIAIAAKMKSGKPVDGKGVQNLANGVQQAAEEVSQTAEEKLATRAQELVEQFNQEAGVKLDQIKFNKGKAYTKNGDVFSGDIIDTLKNGDKVKLVYENGRIQSSTRIGAENFIKEFPLPENGGKQIEKVIKKDLFGNIISETKYLDRGFNNEKAYVKYDATGTGFCRSFDGEKVKTYISL